MREYGIDYGDRVVVGPGWSCVADVMAAAHGYGNRTTGTLVCRDGDGPWVRVTPGGSTS